MDPSLEYLISFLQDEFGDTSGVRVRLIQPSGTLRSPDLPQDYDPETQSLHQRRGVEVRAGSREFFFPVEWVQSKRFSEVVKQVAEVRAWLEGSPIRER
jgi:hypothetical protein